MNLPCDVVRDLIPLCRDGVGSPESCRLVGEHIANCPSCRAEFEPANAAEPTPPAPNEQLLLSRVRASLLRFLALALVGGAVLGVSMTFGSGLFYNFLLMPLVGALSFLVLRQRFYLAMMLIFLLSLISNTIYGMVHYGVSLTTLGSVSSSWLFISAIYAFLVLIGWCIAWLLHYAFSGIRVKQI